MILKWLMKKHPESRTLTKIPGKSRNFFGNQCLIHNYSSEKHPSRSLHRTNIFLGPKLYGIFFPKFISLFISIFFVVKYISQISKVRGISRPKSEKKCLKCFNHYFRQCMYAVKIAHDIDFAAQSIFLEGGYRWFFFKKNNVFCT